MPDPVSFDFDSLLRDGRVFTEFQPICLTREKTVRGVEALSRGRDAAGGRIPPNLLFEAASESGRLLEFDRLCRRRLFEGFRPLGEKYPETLLFFNFETALLDMGVTGSGEIRRAVEACGLEPGRIVIELVESEAKNTEELVRFVEIHREAGFLIALDDIGSGHSNLDRISLIKPDFIKIDRSLVQDIQTEYHRQEVFKSLAGLVHRIGALMVAEGLECLEEAHCCLENGADLLQGFYLARPGAYDDEEHERAQQRVGEVAVGFRDLLMRSIVARNAEHQNFNRIAQEIVARLASTPLENINTVLEDCVDRYEPLECLYVLDARSGIQLSETAMAANIANGRPKVFQPARMNADHSMKEYYFLLACGLNRFVTSPYISMASGNRCVTISLPFSTTMGRRMVLCADLLPGVAAPHILRRRGD